MHFWFGYMWTSTTRAASERYKKARQYTLSFITNLTISILGSILIKDIWIVIKVLNFLKKWYESHLGSKR